MTELPNREVLSLADLREIWPVLAPSDRVQGFCLLDRADADDFFLSLSPRGQATIITGLDPHERRLWMRVLAPDDAADVLQELAPDDRPALLDLLDAPTRREVSALLAYAEDAAGGLMSPRFARVRPDMTVDEAIRYLRRQARDQLETLYYAYILDADQRPLGVVSFRELFSASGEVPVSEVMHRDIASVRDDLDQEQVARLMTQRGFIAIPVLDSAGRMKGIVTLDDIIDVVHEEATEDVHKFGGMGALDVPYLQTGLAAMLRARAVWLVVLLLGEMLTTTAMARYEHEIASAVVLALFVPLIISSGGNSGSQAATLVIRAMALGEVKLRDWWRIMRREILTGAGLGIILAVFGLARVVAWESLFGSYGEHYLLIGFTVALSLMGVVLCGTIAGSMLPLVLRRVGLDPATASAPFVATLVDVAGLIIYFTAADILLSGTLL